jgi:hypothetical protein
MDPESDERRTFRRVHGDGLTVEWRVAPQGILPWKRSEQVSTAHVLDVSVSGASFMTERLSGVRPGSVVTIAHATGQGVVEIRWVRDLGTSKAVYGVEFVVLEPSMRDYLGQPVADRRGPGIQGPLVTPATLPKFT